MLISVVTSVRNGEQFLPRCLESVRAATDSVRDWASVHVEHVVCDGASTDRTTSILEKQACVQWSSEPDSGQSEGFNRAVNRAKGDWICWLNADDELASDAIDSFLQTLQRNPEADIVYGHTSFIDEDSRPLWISYQLPYWWCLIANNVYVPPTSGTFFRRELLLSEPLDVSYHYVMDVEWFLRCGRHINAILTDHVSCHFRISGTGKTSGLIKTGQITQTHSDERERCRQKYIYSQWPQLTAEQAQHKFARRQIFCRLYYYLLKLRYTHRYLADRLFRSRRTARNFF
jgi:glycosyltransferase involved in cell wall biosynthesis